MDSYIDSEPAVDAPYDYPIVEIVLWMIGICLSVVCLVFQVSTYVLIRQSRGVDQKILIHLTAVRLLNTVLEYFVVYVDMGVMDEFVKAIYTQCDAAMICWMYVFTHNLYYKVMTFPTRQLNVVCVSACVWATAVVISIVSYVLLLGESNAHYHYFYMTYALVKFVILSVNLVLFGRIFKMAVSRRDRAVGLLRTCVFSFILIIVLSVQVFVTDLINVFWPEWDTLSHVFYVLNSYQAIEITYIFVVLVNNLIVNEEKTLRQVMFNFVLRNRDVGESKQNSEETVAY